MAKCPGCKKDIGDAHLAYHRGKCKKSKDVLRNALQAHHERLKNTLKSIPKRFHPSRDPPLLNRHRGDASRHTLISTLKVINTDFFTLLQSDLLQVTICAQKTQQNSAREDLDPMPAVENPPVDVESSPSSLDPVRNPSPIPLPPTRSGRQRQAPKRHVDFVPSSLREFPSVVRQIWEERMKRTSSQTGSGLPLPPATLGDNSGSNTILEPPGPVPEAEGEGKMPGVTYYCTEPNDFGIFRQYTSPPPCDPETHHPPDFCIDSPHLKTPLPSHEDSGYSAALRGFGRNAARISKKTLGPFRNITSLRLMSWLYSGKSSKSSADIQELVRDVILADDFEREDLQGFSIRKELDRIDEYNPMSEALTAQDGWRDASVHIPVPMEGCKYSSMADAPTFEVKGLHYRPILEVIKSIIEDPVSKTFHWVPFKQFWSPPPPKSTPYSGPVPPSSDTNPPPVSSDTGSSPSSNSASSSSSRRATVEDVPEDEDNSPQIPDFERIWSEVYNSDTMLDEHEKINSQPRQKDDPDDLPYVIFAFMVYTDVTRLANFGGASLWPAYLFPLNQTKYDRGKPSRFAAHHIAYLTSVCSLLYS